jgi:hypothetical protein
MDLTDFLALYAALLSTALFVIEAVNFLHARPRLRVTIYPVDDHLFDLDTPMHRLGFVFRNPGQRPVTIDAVDVLLRDGASAFQRVTLPSTDGIQSPGIEVPEGKSSYFEMELTFKGRYTARDIAEATVWDQGGRSWKARLSRRRSFLKRARLHFLRVRLYLLQARSRHRAVASSDEHEGQRGSRVASGQLRAAVEEVPLAGADQPVTSGGAAPVSKEAPPKDAI